MRSIKAKLAQSTTDLRARLGHRTSSEEHPSPVQGSPQLVRKGSLLDRGVSDALAQYERSLVSTQLPLVQNQGFAKCLASGNLVIIGLKMSDLA